MESIDPANLADVNKNFNKPANMPPCLTVSPNGTSTRSRLSFLGMDNDTPGVAERTLEQIESWPPGLPVFGQLTAFPGTPLYADWEQPDV